MKANICIYMQAVMHDLLKKARFIFMIAKIAALVKIQ